MIRRLRVRHRRTIVSLAVVVPALFLAALAVRRPMPAGAGTGAEAGLPVGERTLVFAGDDLWAGLALRTQLFDVAAPESRRLLRLEPTAAPELPDLLVYWAPEPEPASWSDGAVLLGTLPSETAREWLLPADRPGGAAVLYSLARREIVGRLPLPEAVP